jgi:transcriptional regulator with XRE-family HTH domain
MSGEESIAKSVDWAAWMRELGAQVLRVREFLGLSQEQLARIAGVSQGAISRLENGRGMATPLLVVIKICAALRDALAHMDQNLLSAEARLVIESGLQLPDPRRPFPNPTHDPGVEELLRVYNRLSDRQREQLLAVLRATARALAGSTRTPAVRGKD